MRVIVDDGVVVGFAIYGPARDHEPSDVGELYAINLDPDARGRGLGRRLLRHVTDQLADLGYRQAVLWVVPANDRARRLYESERWLDDHRERSDQVFAAGVPDALSTHAHHRAVDRGRVRHLNGLRTSSRASR